MITFLEQVKSFFHMLYNKTVWLLSVIFGTIMSAIGYPKQVLSFIFTLILIDIATKHYSIVKINYDKFTIRNYFRAWKDGNLSSRGLKNGLGIKAILYLPILYIAHQAGITKEIIIGETIASVIYSLLMIIEAISIMENFRDCGFKQLAPFLRFFKSKQEEIVGSSIDYDNAETETEGSTQTINQGRVDENDLQG